MLMGFGYWTKASAFWSLDYCSILLICTQTLPLGLFHVFEDTWDAWMIIHASQTLAGVLNLAGPPLLGLLASRLATVLLILAKCPSSSSLCPPGWTPALWCLSWEHLLSLEPLPLLLLQLGERALAQLIPLHQCLPQTHVNHLQNPSVPGIYSMIDMFPQFFLSIQLDFLSCKILAYQNPTQCQKFYICRASHCS